MVVCRPTRKAISSSLILLSQVELLMLSSVRTLLRQPRAIRRFNSSIVLRSSTEMDKVNTTERLSKLRELMKQHKVDIYSTGVYSSSRKAD